ncbi:MAG: excinuclease ABC subunit UvrC [Oscillospiraceae bacterium]|nr:excinuclease ABC subunit UvrC [Oscillospiraceae bacterium]
MEHLEHLRKKALGLPETPGVYLMLDKKGSVIYVGKAKRLKHRVISYFQSGGIQDLKTRRLVTNIADFDTIATQSEFESLVLECSLIKCHQPKYNILLKDGKGYPFIRLPKEPYPSLTVSHKPAKDSARYFGPYGGTRLTHQVIEAVCQALRLPVCGKAFPRDIGKERPCLQYHMNCCIGVCNGDVSPEAYAVLIRKAVMLLEGKTPGLLRELEIEMNELAQNLAFEAAGLIRDEIRSLEALSRRQLVVGSSMADTDAIAVCGDGNRAVAVVLHFMDGNLIAKDCEVIRREGAEDDILSSFVTQYYMLRDSVPRHVLLSHPIEDKELLEAFFKERGSMVTFFLPQKGKKRQLIALALDNARKTLEQTASREEKTLALLNELQRLLELPHPPRRIEAVDISNTGNSERVGVLACFQDGRPLKKAYRHFTIKDISIADDLHSMQELLTRRFSRLKNGDMGFEILPDLLLADGGKAHAAMAERVFRELGLNIPAFGMVKDSRHRTRAIISPDGREAGLEANPALFALIGRIQEETHNAAFSFHQKRRSSFTSELDKIPGIGPARRQALLKRFKSIKRVRAAPFEELREVLGESAARAAVEYFGQPESNEG